jgi:glycosyltransferase involved in cell wall biosynthesis
MNAPLLEEQRRYRELVLADDAEAIEAEVLHGADHLVAVSDGVREYAIAKGSDPARAYVLPNGVDTARFHPDVVPARTAAEGPREFTIGFTGSLKPWHGMDLLMKAFRKLLTTDGRYRLLVVGDGPLRPWIDGFASGAGIEDRVELTGWIPNDALPGVLQRMDVTVAPYPRLDGFYFSPLKLFEYMAMGKPVVASAIGQVCDIVEHGRTGLLAEPGDIAQLAAHVERIRCDSDLRSRLGAAAAERARAFTWSNNARRVVELARSMSRAA